MSVCRYFLAGNCRYGDRCRFSHQTTTERRCLYCSTEPPIGRRACLKCRPDNCLHCQVPLKGGVQYCSKCTPNQCTFCINRPGAKARNIVRGNLSRVCCEECKDYYCVEHTNNLSKAYYKDIVCKECREKCFYCQHRTEKHYNKKPETQKACQECLDYFCTAHNWNRAKDLECSWICSTCQRECWICRSPGASQLSICKKCAETHCPTCHRDEAEKVGNTFRCDKCTYLHGCRLTVHGVIRHRLCTCDERRRLIVGDNRFQSLPEDLIHPDYEVLATYEVNEEEHGGYCSDRFDDRMIEKTITVVCPLPINFTPNNVDWSLYQKEDKAHGNGYCGMKTTYALNDLKVVPKGEGYETDTIKKKKHRRKYSWSTDDEYKTQPRYSDSSSESSSEW